MTCHICGNEAIERCFTCGELFCEKHGSRDCVRCQTGVMEGDPRPDRVSSTPTSRSSRPGWWRPRRAEEFDPAACYVCQALAGEICRICNKLYCKAHAGANGLCTSCDRSSRIGAYVFVMAMAAMVLFVLIGRFAW